MKTLDAGQFVSLLPVAQRRVGAFVAAIMPRCLEVDEIVQSTLVVAWKKLADFQYAAAQPEDELVRWLCAIARFEALALARRRGDERLVFDDRIIDHIVELQVDDSEYWDQRRAALRLCVEKLTSSDRALVDSAYRGVRIVDLAGSAGKTRQSVYKALRKIRSGLLACIETQLQEWEA